MAGPAFRSIGSRATSAGAATIAAALPTLESGNGVLLAVVTSKNNAVHSCSTGGWTKLNQTNSGASFTASLWLAAEGASAPTFTWTGSVACSAQVAYYSDPQNTMNVGVSVLGTAGTGTTSPHSSTAITTDADNTLAIFVDVAAANTSVAQPTGWTRNSDVGSNTDAGRTAFGSKPIASSGSSSGAISTSGANAAWVEWQLELKGSAATAGLQVSKEEVAAWLEPPAGFDAAKVTVDAWLDSNDLHIAQVEVLAWLDGTAVSSGRRRMSLM